DVPRAEVGVPVRAGAGLVAGVVGVDQVDAPRDRADVGDGGGQVDPARPGVARVEREPDVLGATGLLDGSPELLDPFETPRHRVVAAGSVLDEYRDVRLQRVDRL